MVPPWADPPAGDAPADGGDAPDNPGDDADGANNAPPNAVPVAAPVPIAPSARFRGARRALGGFAKSGDNKDMRRGLSHYVKTGYGGAATATRRMGSTATTAGALHGALSSLALGQPAEPGSPLDPALLAGKTAQEITNAVVEAVRPVDGTQDAEASRSAICEAISDLLTAFPNADLLDLDPDQRSFVIEHYAALDVFQRFELDVGKAIHDKAASATSALSRLKEVRDYVKETVAASFRELRGAGQAIDAGKVSEVVRDALRETFQVFEDYVE